MSKIILLNGCGSSGKTSIAQAVGHLCSELWLTFGVDTFIDLIPFGRQESYLKFIPGQNESGPTMHVDAGPNAQKLFGVMPRFAEMLAASGNNLIIDEVLFHEDSLKAFAENLKHHTAYYIGIFCDLKVMQEREILRRDRGIGLSNDQIDRVHQGALNSYDFKVDTSKLSPFEAARQILTFIDNNPAPQAFRKIARDPK
jgi:chloramphenicol 3-O phosphotransferase